MLGIGLKAKFDSIGLGFGSKGLRLEEQGPGLAHQGLG